MAGSLAAANVNDTDSQRCSSFTPCEYDPKWDPSRLLFNVRSNLINAKVGS